MKDHGVKPKGEMLCELCFPVAVEIGQIFPGGWLVENKGWYFIIASDGHKDDILLFFPNKPTPDPDPDVKEPEKYMWWVDAIADWENKIKMTPQDGYFLVSGCLEAGWKGSKGQGTMLVWLYERAAKMVEDYEKSHLDETL